MKVTEITQTCSACPSQWEGKIEDGRMFYARYRWGCLSVRLSETPTENLYEVLDGNTLIDLELGDEFDGVLSEGELVEQMEKVGFKF
jgi:hypothetical protein